VRLFDAVATTPIGRWCEGCATASRTTACLRTPRSCRGPRSVTAPLDRIIVHPGRGVPKGTRSREPGAVELLLKAWSASVGLPQFSDEPLDVVGVGAPCGEASHVGESAGCRAVGGGVGAL